MAMVESSVKQGKNHDNQPGYHSQRHRPAAGRDKHRIWMQKGKRTVKLVGRSC